MLFGEFEEWLKAQPGFERKAINPFQGPRGEIISEYYLIAYPDGKRFAPVPGKKPTDDMPPEHIRGICRQLGIHPPDSAATEEFPFRVQEQPGIRPS